MRDEAVKYIGERQAQILKTGKYPPICIYPEGGNSNQEVLLQFKRGAFSSILPVKPLILKYGYKMFSPTYDCVSFLAFATLFICSSGSHCEILELPVFAPNEYLLKTHADKAKTG